MPGATEHINLGIGAFNAGDVDMAIEELETATQLDRTNFKAFNYLGAAYAAKKRFNAAVGAFKLAEQLAPKIASIHFNIAQAYEADDVLSEAEYEYQRALEIDPKYTRAAEALEKLKKKLNHV